MCFGLFSTLLCKFEIIYVSWRNPCVPSCAGHKKNYIWRNSFLGLFWNYWICMWHKISDLIWFESCSLIVLLKTLWNVCDTKAKTAIILQQTAACFSWKWTPEPGVHPWDDSRAHCDTLLLSVALPCFCTKGKIGQQSLWRFNKLCKYSHLCFNLSTVGIVRIFSCVELL